MAEVFQVKSIKPKKLNVDAFVKEIRAALEDEGDIAKREYEKTTTTWRRKPKFGVSIKSGGKDTSVLIGTGSWLAHKGGGGAAPAGTDVHQLVDQGTRPHVVKPVRAPRLRFQSGYRAKTAPRKIGSKAGGPHGPVVYAKQVMHPGTQPREFSRTIQGQREKPFARRMAKAMDKAGSKAF